MPRPRTSRKGANKSFLKALEVMRSKPDEACEHGVSKQEGGCIKCARGKKKRAKRPKLSELNSELQQIFEPKTVTLTPEQIKFVNPHTFVELGAKLRFVREKVQSWNGKTDRAWSIMNELRAFFEKEGKEGLHLPRG